MQADERIIRFFDLLVKGMEASDGTLSLRITAKLFKSNAACAGNLLCLGDLRRIQKPRKPAKPLGRGKARRAFQRFM